MTLPVYDKGFTQEEIDFGFEQFVHLVNEKIAKHYREKFPTLSPRRVTVNSRGRVYWKLVSEADGAHSSVYCFVRKEDGAVLKAASWKAPALNHARSFVTDTDHGMSGVGVYGAAYMI